MTRTSQHSITQKIAAAALNERRAREQEVIERALRFADWRGSIDVVSVRRLRRECGIDWPRITYTLRSDGETVQLERSRPRPRKRYGAAARNDAKEIDAVRTTLKTSLKEIAIAVADGDRDVLNLMSYRLDELRAIDQMVQRPVRYNAELPAEILAAYAVALLSDLSLPWHKHVKICKYCKEALLAPKTPGRRADRHDDCQKPWHNEYMTPERRKGKSQSD